MQNKGRGYGHKIIGKMIAFTTVKNVVEQVFIFMEVSSKKY